MNCPECGGKTRVTNSRLIEDNIVRRRRECLVCLQRFSTLEEIMGETWQSATGKKVQKRKYRDWARSEVEKMMSEIRQEIYAESQEQWF